MLKGRFVTLLSRDEIHVVRLSGRAKVFHTKSGMVDLKELKRKNVGDVIKTHLGKEFRVVESTFKDVIEKKAERAPQIVMPKDVGLILASVGLDPRKRLLIVDAGTGSGFLAMYLANFFPRSKVVTYEKNEEFARVAERNFRLLGLKNVVLKRKDALEGFDEKNVDLVTLDMKDAEKMVGEAYEKLKPGGWLVVYSPTIEQVIRVRKEISRMNFCEVRTIENVVREWQVETGRRTYTRPRTSGIMHTGFITFARKVG